jgi:hypothetical protein
MTINYIYLNKNKNLEKDILIYMYCLFRENESDLFLRREFNEFIITKMMSIEMLRVINIR